MRVIRYDLFIGLCVIGGTKLDHMRTFDDSLVYIIELFDNLNSCYRPIFRGLSEIDFLNDVCWVNVRYGPVGSTNSIRVITGISIMWNLLLSSPRCSRCMP